MDDFDAVQDRLTRLHPTLPPQLRNAAAYLLDNPGEIATQSMRTIASQSGVPLANFARLAQAVGFEKYNDLRDVYRRSVQLGGAEGYPERAAKLQASGKASGDAVRKPEGGYQDQDPVRGLWDSQRFKGRIGNLDYEPRGHRVHGCDPKYIPAPQLREDARFGAGHMDSLGRRITAGTATTWRLLVELQRRRARAEVVKHFGHYADSTKGCSKLRTATSCS